MAKINVLDKSVYNLISAGEVIERPSSIVKELVENSIDAGATEITVSVLDGGKNQILIIDNGCGIAEDDLQLCYLPHSTSKIEKAQDLEEISTLGFRGEALASITAISQVKISSKTKDMEVGNYIQVNGGVVEEEGKVGMSTGTTICAENIFFNTPVRRKFLKKGKQEEFCITQVMTDLIFANPDIKFTYMSENKVIFKTNGGLENALYAIYPTDTANKMIPFDNQVGNIRVYGYTGDRTLFKHNKSSQTIIINGRTISNTTIQTAVSQAYGEHLMKRCYPVFVLNIIMPFDEVDVNVHPSKNEVRFEDTRKIFSAVYHSINSALAQMEEKLVIGGSKQESNEQLPFTDFDRSIETPVNNTINSYTNDGDLFHKLPNEYSFTPEKKAAIEQSKKQQESFNCNYLDDEIFKNINESDTNLNIQNNIRHDYFDNTGAKEVVSSNYTAIKQFEDGEQSSLFQDAENACVQDYRIIGQLFSTFLILESGETCYIIDQHAMHERFLYDKLMDKLDKQAPISQPMLIPYIVECNANQYDYFMDIIKPLTELGFEIEEFGGLSFKVNAVPAILTNINLQTFFNNILYDKNKNYNVSKGDLIRNKLATQACKAAIKGGDVLTNMQIRAILDKMKDGIPVQCPHGRPAILEVTRTDLDKMFKRIV